MWYLVAYSNCLEYNFLKEQMVINLSAMLLLKVSLYVILFVTVPLHYINYIHGMIFVAPGF